MFELKVNETVNSTSNAKLPVVALKKCFQSGES